MNVQHAKDNYIYTFTHIHDYILQFADNSCMQFAS